MDDGCALQIHSLTDTDEWRGRTSLESFGKGPQFAVTRNGVHVPEPPQCVLYTLTLLTPSARPDWCLVVLSRSLVDDS